MNKENRKIFFQRLRIIRVFVYFAAGLCIVFGGRLLFKTIQEYYQSQPTVIEKNE